MLTSDIQLSIVWFPLFYWHLRLNWDWFVIILELNGSHSQSRPSHCMKYNCAQSQSRGQGPRSLWPPSSPASPVKVPPPSASVVQLRAGPAPALGKTLLSTFLFCQNQFLEVVQSSPRRRTSLESCVVTESHWAWHVPPRGVLYHPTGNSPALQTTNSLLFSSLSYDIFPLNISNR